MNFIRQAIVIQLLMFAFILIVAMKLWYTIQESFSHNVYLNGLILGLFVLAVILIQKNYAKIHMGFKQADISLRQPARKQKNLQTTLFSPLYSFLGSTVKSPTNQQLCVHNIEQNIDSILVTPRYIAGTLVFIGLVGTFWGLSRTVSAVANVISAIDMQAADVQEAFQVLKSGLKSPLEGMGTAFSTSLFGLVGSLLLNFLIKIQNSYSQKIIHYISSLLMQFSIEKPHNIAQGNEQTVIEQVVDNLNALNRFYREQVEGNRQSEKRHFQTLENMHQLLSQQGHLVKATQEMAHSQLSQKQSLLQQQDLAEEHLKAWRLLDQRVENLSQQLDKLLGESQQEICQEIRGVSRILNSLMQTSA